MKVHLSRWVCQDVETNLKRLAEESAEAAAGGADLVVFPESFLHGYKRTVEPARARAAFEAASATQPATVFVFGSHSEERRNRMTVWRAGYELARYDKVHLFEPNDEHNLWDPGDRYVAVEVDGRVFGLLNCNDVRFPEQARALRLEARCEALIVPAWWPWRRDDIWRTLLRARAIENGVHVLGCCISASEHPDERFAGAGNYVFDPHGNPVRSSDDQTYTIDLDAGKTLLVDPLAAWRDVTRIVVFSPERS